MNWYYKYSTNSWVLLPVSQDGYEEPEQKINGASSIRLSIPINHFAILNDGIVLADEVAWDETNAYIPGMLVVAVANNITATILNACFDGVNKLFLGHVISWDTDDKNIYVNVEEWHQPWLLEKITESENVRPEASAKTMKIKSFVNEKTILEVDHADSSAITWAADFHNARTCRVEKKTPVKTKGYVAATPTGTNTPTTVGAYTDMDEDDNTSCLLKNFDKATTGLAEFLETVVFPASRHPGTTRIYLKLTFLGQGGANLAFTTLPYIKMYMADGTTLSDSVYAPAQSAINNVVNTNDTTLFNSCFIVTLDISEANVPLYYDVANQQFKIQIYSGVYTPSSTTYYSIVTIYYAYIEYDFGADHDPAEFLIADTGNNDELTLTTVADIYDTKTQRLNIGDTVKILYNDEEFLESKLNAYLLTDRIASINAVACTLGTYSLFNYMQISQHITDAMYRNKQFYYLSRYTQASKAILFSKLKASPTVSGITITPANLEKGFNTLVGFNARDKLRAVIVKNETTKKIWNGSTEALPAVSIYPIGVADRKGMPTSMLLDYATNALAQRNAITKNIRVKVANLTQIDEDFEWMTADDVPSTVDALWWSINFTPSATLYAKVIAGKKLKIYDNDGTNGIDITKTLKCPRSHYLPTPYNVINFKINAVEGDGATCMSYYNLIKDNGSTVWLYLRVLHMHGALHDHAFLYYSADGSSWSNSIDLTYAEHTLNVKLTAVNAFELWLDSDAHTVVTGFANSYTSYINKLQFKTAAANAVSAPTGVDETFDGTGYDVGDDIVGLGVSPAIWEQWSTITTHPEVHAAVYSSSGNCLVFGHTGSEVDQVWLPFPVACKDDGTWNKITWKALASSTNIRATLWPFETNGGSTFLTNLTFRETGQIQDHAGDFSPQMPFVANTWYDCEINFMKTGTDWKYYIRAKKTTDSTWATKGTSASPLDASTDLKPIGIRINAPHASYFAQFYVDDIDFDWVTTTTVYPVHVEIDDICSDGLVNVQESSAAVFHAGAQLHAHLCPTENNGTDYKVNADFVAREVKWTKDECAELKLGFAEQEMASSQEAMMAAIVRARQESTS
jgi:hypothetical protein